MSKRIGKNTEEVSGEWGMPLAGGSSPSPVIQNTHPMEIRFNKNCLFLTSDAKWKFQ